MTTIDVVIATYNRHERLNECLERLRHQTFRDFSVIVADDGSTPPVEDTIPAELREALGLRVCRLAKNGGPARARNAAVAMGSAPYIAFIDDDVRAEPDLLERHLEAVASAGGPAAVFGPLAAPWGWRPNVWNLWEVRLLEFEYRKMLEGIYEPTWRQFFTGNAVVRRKDFVAAGGFDERFTRAEDVELAIRLEKVGCRFIFQSRAIGWHHAQRSMTSWLALPREYARFDVAIDALHPDLEWLDRVRYEMSQRNALTRIVSNTLGRGPLRPLATRAAVEAARLLHRFRLSGGALRLVSLAYDIEYRASHRRALANPAAVIDVAARPAEGAQAWLEPSRIRG